MRYPLVVVMVVIGCAPTWRRTVTLEETTHVRLRLADNPTRDAAEACHRRCTELPRGIAACLARCPGAEVAGGACEDTHPGTACVAMSRVHTVDVNGRCQDIEPRVGVAVITCTDKEGGSIGGGILAIIVVPIILGLVAVVSQI